MPRNAIIRLQAILLLCVLLISCSGMIPMRLKAYIPSDPKQEAYEWTRHAGGMELTTPTYTVVLLEGSYWWTGAARSGGSFVMDFAIQEVGELSAEIRVVEAFLEPIRVKSDRGIEIEERYTLTVEERRGEREESQGLASADARSTLAARVPFRPRKVHITMVLESENTGERESHTFEVRERRLF